MKKILIFLIACMFLISMFQVINAERHVDITEDFENFSPDEVIVKFKRGLSESDVNSIAYANGLSVISKSQYSGIHILKILNELSVVDIAEKLNNNPNIEYAEPNYIANACMIPNDPEYSLQWHLHDLSQGGINMEPAWDITNGSGVVVAIVDTGISQAGEDLTSTSFVQGYDFVNNDNDPTDDHGHGTHVAGTVAQSTNNGIGVCGVAYGASLMPVKVLDNDGYGWYTDIANGIIWATQNGANIISMSLGGSSPSTTLENALAYAYTNGVTCIAASGNNGHNGVSYPAAYDAYVIAVGATRYDKNKAYYSNYGNSLDIVAPGGDVTVDQNNDGHDDGVYQETFYPNWGYYFWQGTSMATPHVSGVAALLYSNGVTTPDDIRNTLQSSAVDLGSPGWDLYYGYGLINAYNALTYISGNNPPVADFTYTTSGLTVDFTDQSSDSDGSISSWSWNFGDGSTSTAQNPSHTYAADGTYTVSLTVSDDDEATDSTSQSVTISSGIIIDMHVQDVYLWLAGTAGPWEYIGVEATIFDSNDNTVVGVNVDLQLETPVGGTLMGTATTDSSGVASIVFEKASRSSGLYTGTVIGLTKSGYSWDISADVETSDILDTSGTNNNPPAADFTYTISDLTAYFTDVSTDSDGSINGWSWDFGDGSISIAQDPSHTYAADGTYTVSLTVTDDDGATDSTSQSVTVPSGGGTGDMYVSDISWSSAGPNLKSIVTIKEDSAGGFVGGAIVYYTLTNQITDDSKTFTGITGSNGQIQFMWKKAPAGNYEGRVTGITHSSYNYDSNLDVDNPDYYTH